MLRVEEIGVEDIEALCNYWLDSSDEHLVAMGVDLQLLPSRDQLEGMLLNQINTPYDQKSSFALIAHQNDRRLGHCNLSNIQDGEAYLHLHLWDADQRGKGHGTEMVRQSIPIFFDRIPIDTIWCMPYALNPAPARTLEKLGFEFLQRFTTVPGGINFEQEVNQYRLLRSEYEGWA